MTRQSGLPKESRRRLGFRYAVHVQAAEYWLALGKPDEANAELQRIQLNRRNHPEVKRVRAMIEAESHASRVASR